MNWMLINQKAYRGWGWECCNKIRHEILRQIEQLELEHKQIASPEVPSKLLDSVKRLKLLDTHQIAKNIIYS